MGKWWNGSVTGPWDVTGHPATYRCLRQLLNPDLSSRVPSRSRSSKETLCDNCPEWVRPQRSLSIFHNSHWSPAEFFICTQRNLLVRLPWSCASHRGALRLAVKKYGKLWSKRKKDWRRIGSAVCPQLWLQLTSPRSWDVLHKHVLKHRKWKQATQDFIPCGDHQLLLTSSITSRLVLFIFYFSYHKQKFLAINLKEHFLKIIL